MNEKHCLSFEGKGLKLDKANDVCVIINDIKKNKKLKTLNLSGNTLGVSAAEKLGEHLDICTDMEVCKLNDLFTGRSKAEIPPALKSLSTGIIKSNTHLVEIDLSDNAFGPNGVVGVTELLSSPVCYTLKYLKMNNQGLGHAGCDLLVDALIKGRNESGGKGLSLKLFYGGRNRLENHGAKRLNEFFSSIKTLEEIAIYQNGIGIHGHKGAEYLAEIIKNNKKLEYIDISDNTLTPEGFRKLIPSFKKLKNLRVLKVDDCLIKSTGLNKFSQQFEDEEFLSNLEVFSVVGNEITASAMKKFIINIRSLKNFKRLYIKANNFGKNGIQDILGTLQSVEMTHVIFKPDDYDESVLQDLELVKDLAFSDDESDDEGEVGEYDETFEEVDENSDDEDEYEEESSGHIDTSSLAQGTFSFQKTASAMKLPVTPSGGLFGSPCFQANFPQNSSLQSGGSKGSTGLFAQSRLNTAAVQWGKLVDLIALPSASVSTQLLSSFKVEFARQGNTVDLALLCRDMQKCQPELLVHCALHLLEGSKEDASETAIVRSSVVSLLSSVLSYEASKSDFRWPSFTCRTVDALLVHLGVMKYDRGDEALLKIVNQAKPYLPYLYEVVEELVMKGSKNFNSQACKNLYYVLKHQRDSQCSSAKTEDGESLPSKNQLDKTIEQLRQSITNLKV